MTITSAIPSTKAVPRMAAPIFAMATKPVQVMIIDDDEIFIFLTGKMLQSTGQAGKIHVCRSAFEAIEFFYRAERSELPDVILLDLNMPGMDGWQFLEHFHGILPALHYTPRLYVVSSSVATEDAEKANSFACVTGYIPKPLNVERLKRMLEQ